MAVLLKYTKMLDYIDIFLTTSVRVPIVSESIYQAQKCHL